MNVPIYLGTFRAVGVGRGKQARRDAAKCAAIPKPPKPKLKKRKIMKQLICCLCGDPITPEPVTGWEYGCNPWPLAKRGKCCWVCDKYRVTPARHDLEICDAVRAKLNKERKG